MRVVVLGAGMVGSAIAMDLAKQALDVTVVDVRADALARVRDRHGVGVVQADLSDARRLAEVVAPFDAVCGALSSHMGFATLRAIVEARKPYCDVSFMAEDAWELDGLAKGLGVTAVVDCGVSPGISNVVIGDAVRALAPCERVEILVGGLPEDRRWPTYYKAPFAPSDVIEEYLRPARRVERGEVVVEEALTGAELVDVPGVGTLEAVNTDGLRSLAYTTRVPFMREKTLRYPGHYELMRALRKMGFFSSEPLDVAGAKVRPVDVASKLLFREWAFEEGEVDVTVLRIVVEGRDGGRRVRRTWDMVDRFDPKSGYRSMSRTTGFPAAIVTGMLARGELARPGVHPPEKLGAEPGFAAKFLDALRERGIALAERTEALE